MESLLNNVASLKAYNFVKKEIPTGVLCEICEIFKNTFLTKHLRWLLLFIRENVNLTHRLALLPTWFIFVRMFSTLVCTENNLKSKQSLNFATRIDYKNLRNINDQQP